MDPRRCRRWNTHEGESARLPALVLSASIRLAVSRMAGVVAALLTAIVALSVGRFVRPRPQPRESTQEARLIPNPPCAGAPSADGRWVACIEWPQSMRDRRAPLAFTLVLFNTETGDRRILKTAPQDQEIMGAVIAARWHASGDAGEIPRVSGPRAHDRIWPTGPIGSSRRFRPT